MIHVKHILYATDFSSYSNQAYFHAVALAQSHGACLTVLHVYSPTHGTPEIEGKGANRQYWRDQLRQIRPVDGSIKVQHVMLEGDPAAQIVRFARESAVDVIAMGTHGRTGLERLLLGSVAEKVLREAPCSVLVVKLPKPVPAPSKAPAEPASSLA